MRLVNVRDVPVAQHRFYRMAKMRQSAAAQIKHPGESTADSHVGQRNPFILLQVVDSIIPVQPGDARNDFEIPADQQVGTEGRLQPGTHPFLPLPLPEIGRFAGKGEEK